MRYIFLLLWVPVVVIHTLDAVINVHDTVSSSGDPSVAQHRANFTSPGSSGDGGFVAEEAGSAEAPVAPEDISDGSAEGPIPPGGNDETEGPPMLEIVTGTPEESTMPPKDPAGENMEDPETEEPIPAPTTPFDINMMETGSPEGSTKEPYMPKPKPKPGQDNNGSFTDSSEKPFTEGYVTDEQEYPSELPLESISPDHWRTTTSNRFDFTISQKIDETSPGYKQLLHMLEDLDTRRKEDQTGTNQTEFYIDRATVSMDNIDNSIANTALANITLAQEYIKSLLAGASLTVRQGYAEIVSLTSTPSFYYIPKKQRYVMVNQIITDMGTPGELEMMALNKKAKDFCKNSNVDTPPYTLGNIVGSKLGNGAILTK